MAGAILPPSLSPVDIKAWIEENRQFFDPPYKTSRIVAHDKDFFVMVLHGPNARLDFHRETGEEFFQQIYGEIELHLKPESGRRQVVKIREGEIFLCPAGLAHSPRRGPGTWGLVIERKRKPDEPDEFLWFCENCDEQVHSQSVSQENVAAQVRRLYETFNANPAIRSCRKCGYVFPIAPLAERLGFL
jgi:3-hydroxyanthranilate 3,4-dioxygenase